MKILVAVGDGQVKDSFFTPQVIEKLEKLGTVVYNQTGRQRFTKQELMDNIGDVDVLISGWVLRLWTAGFCSAAKQLKVHAHTGGSVASYVSKRGI